MNPIPDGTPTGIYDINGGMICVGDLVGHDPKYDTSTFIVVFEGNAFRKMDPEYPNIISKPILEHGEALKHRRFVILENHKTKEHFERLKQSTLLNVYKKAYLNFRADGTPSFKDESTLSRPEIPGQPPMLDRLIDGLPGYPCIMEVMKKNYDGDELCLCRWHPKSKFECNSYGYLGSARDLNGEYWYNAWAQKDKEFTHYRVMYRFSDDDKSELIPVYIG